MKMTQTESTNMEFFTQQQWILRMPLNFPVLDIEAPKDFTEIKSYEIQDITPGNLIIVWQNREHTIDTLTHNALLDESIREYSNIWRTLAGK